MTEQNNTLNNAQNPQQPVPVQPTPQPNVVAQPVEAINPVPQPPVAPATQVAETPVAPATPVAETPVAPTPTPVVAPTPVDVQPVTPELPAVAPVASPAPVSAPADPNLGNMPQTVSTFEGSAVANVEPIAGAAPTLNDANGGFVPGTVAPEKKTNKGLMAVIIVAVIAVLGVLGYFVVYPLILKSLVTPEKVYTNTINAVFKEITTTVEEVVHEKATYSIDLAVDSNMPTISSFSGYNYSVNVGVDPTTEAFQAGLTMKNSSTNYSVWGYIKDGKKYTRYSTDDVLNYIGELSTEESNELFDTFKQALDTQDGADTEKINYVINKINELVVSSIDETKLTQEDVTIKIGGTDVKVLNNKYVMDEAAVEKTAKHVLDGLKGDKTVVKNLSELLDSSEDEVKEMLTYEEPEKDEETEEEKEETPLIVNIYVTNKGDFVGVAFTDDKGNVDLHYYNNNGSFEIKLYEKSVDEETNKETENTASIVGVPKSGKTNVTVTYNKETVATLVINKNTETELDLNYEIVVAEDQKINGTLAIKNDNNDKRIKNTIKFTMKASDQYLNIDLGTTIDWTTEVAKINTGNAVTVTEEEHANKKTAFRDQVNNTPIGLFFQTTSGNMSGGINDYYDDEYYNDDYYEITDDEEIIIGDNTNDENDFIYEDTTDEDSIVYID